MNCLRRPPVAMLAALAALGFVPSAEARPNVVVVMTDDQRADSLEVMPAVKRQLARYGATFENSFATTPACCPSRATYLTGRYAHNHGVLTNGHPYGYRALDQSRTLGMWLRRAGYRTAWIGKFLNGYGLRRPREVPLGFTRWYGSVDPSTYRMYGYTLNENGRLRGYGHGPRAYQTDVYAGKAVRFLRHSAGERRPFFLTVSTLAPHGEATAQDPQPDPRPAPRHLGSFADEPLPASPAFDEEDVSDKPEVVRALEPLNAEQRDNLTQRHRARRASLLAVDDLVRRLVRVLRRTGELHRTLVIFTSDNGFMLGEHRTTAKSWHYEESIRVPLVIRGPRIPHGVERRQLVGNVDLAPTILHATRARDREHLDGRSLIPLARRPGAPGRDVLLLESFHDEKAWTALRTRRHLYAEHPTGERELYDLRSDPFQLGSMHLGGPHETPESAELEAHLAARLAELRDCRGAACREARNARAE